VNKLRWFGHMERMTSILAYKAEREGERPRIEWIEGVKNILKDGVGSARCRRASTRVEEAKDLCKGKVRGRSILSAYLLMDMTWWHR
jgi:hypothetical protein